MNWRGIICIILIAASLLPLPAEEIRVAPGRPVVPDISKIGDRQERLQFYLRLAADYMRRQEYDSALDAYARAMENQPGKKGTYAILIAVGDIYLGRGAFEKAIDFYQEAVALYPGRETARLSLGKAYEQSELFELAREEYRTVLKKNRKSYEANFLLASLYLKQGMNTQAMEYYRSALTLKPGLELYRSMAHCAENMGDISLALAMLRQATYLKVDYADLLTLGRMYTKQKRHKDAGDAYSQAIRLDPSQPEAYISLALLYIEDGDLSPAEQLLLVAREKTTAENAIIHFFLGTIYYRQSRIKDAQAEIAAAKKTSRTGMLSRYSGKFSEFLLSPYAGKKK
jgi:tetratricopeptide (TPR) repeat protein